jgi:hypothetical protein
LQDRHKIMTEADEKITGRTDRLRARPGPQYLDFEEARQLLAEMNVHLTPRQIKRSSDKDAAGRRKLPWFIDPIEGRLKIERNALLSAYFNRQVEAERNCTS